MNPIPRCGAKARLHHLSTRTVAVLAVALGLLAGLLVAATATASAASTASAAAAIAMPSLRAPAGLPAAIEPLAAYVGQVSCQPTFRSGTKALGTLLVRTYPNTSFGGAYSCGTDGPKSEHYDGRAVDWMNSVRNPQQAAQAASVIKFMLATDKAGNRFANARRIGVMYLIWNNQIWGAWDGKWAPYRDCAKTTSSAQDSYCHRNHMHFSLSWNGAFSRTSFWSMHTVATVDYGPCKESGLNWAANYARVNGRECPPTSPTPVPARSSNTYRELAGYSGVAMNQGFAGPPITVVQRALGVPQSGVLDTRSLAALNGFKRSHKLAANGVIDTPAWRTLLAAYRPR